MRQRTLRLTVLALITLLLTSLTLAQPRPTSSVPASRLGVLSGLAAYVPSDALIYASAHSDADSIAGLNTLMNDLMAGLPNVTPPPPIEGLLGESLGVPFSEIQAWLGEGLAIAGLPKVVVDQWGAPYDYFAVVQISDAAAAEAFLVSRLGAEKVLALNDVFLLGEPQVLARFGTNAP